MNKALIVTGYLDYPDSLIFSPAQTGCVIAADKGLLIARQLGLTPDLLIGDYDSMEQPDDENVIKLPAVKDMTDTEAALDLAIQRGFTDVTILGGLGGRFDHTMGNIALLKKYLGKLEGLCLRDAQNLVTMHGPGRFSIPAEGHPYLGLIAYDSPCTKLCVSGTRYTLSNHTLTNDSSLSVSNEITAEAAELSFARGTLLVIRSRDRA